MRKKGTAETRQDPAMQKYWVQYKYLTWLRQHVIDVHAAVWRDGHYDYELLLYLITLPNIKDINADARELRRILGIRTGMDFGHRWDVLRRDGGTCVACGSTEHLTVDHILPVSRGGTNEPDNLQCLCRHCNSTKGKRTNDEWGGVG